MAITGKSLLCRVADSQLLFTVAHLMIVSIPGLEFGKFGAPAGNFLDLALPPNFLWYLLVRSDFLVTCHFPCRRCTDVGIVSPKGSGKGFFIVARGGRGEVLGVNIIMQPAPGGRGENIAATVEDLARS
jgi:hypothetical protein